MSKKNRNIAAAALLFAVLTVVMMGIYKAAQPQNATGEKNIVVRVIHKDGSEKTFSYTTDEEYLGPFLLEMNLVEGEEGEYGLFVETVDGQRADYQADQSFWCLQVDGKDSMSGADKTPLENGKTYTWIYTEAK